MSIMRTTEQNTFSMCEQKWYYRYVKGYENDSSGAMTKGTLWHAFWDEWWVTPGGLDRMSWNNVLDRMDDETNDKVTEQIASDVMWMAKRYDAWRPGGWERTEWKVLHQEKELEAKVNGVTLQGRLDDLRLHVPTDTLWIGECKTMADWRRLDILEVDPQLSNYMQLAMRNGYDVKGVFYDAARTYRWKRDEDKHPPSDSFREMTYLRDEPQLWTAAKELVSVTVRADLIRDGVMEPIHNISANTCSFCPYRDRCYEDMAFPQEELNWTDS
jgi:hypothetical protein